MGITNFLKWLDNFEGMSKYRLKNLPKNIGNVYIDTNGILHTAAQTVYNYGGKTPQEKEEQTRLRLKDFHKTDALLLKEYILEIYKRFDELLFKLRPSDNLFICPDGVAPMNKLKQQKERRFRADAQKSSSEEKSKEEKKKDVRFEPSVITPGTDLTMFIEQRLEDWILQTRRKKDHLLPKRVLYSGFLVNGEGEHKIFKYIRDGLSIHQSEEKKASVIYGLDADLVVLSVLSGIENLYLVREKFTDIVFIDELRNSIYNTLKFTGCEKDKIMKDFSVLVSFAGNDFLPKFPFFTETNEMITFAFECYKKIKCHITKEDGHIDLKNFIKLLKEMEKRQMIYYESIYENKIRGMVAYSEIIKNSVTFGEYNRGMEYSINIIRMKNDWYLHEFRPNRTELKNYFKDSYEKDDTPNYLEIKDNPYFDYEDVEKMVIDFIRTMEWSLLYYTKGEEYINRNFFYKYMHAPMLEDCILVLEKLISGKLQIDFSHIIIDKTKEITITPIHQLLMVIPPDSLGLIPKKYHEFYKEISCSNPDYFDVSMEGCTKDWQAHPIIPNIDPDISSFILRNTKLDKYYEKGYKLFDKVIDYVKLGGKVKSKIAQEVEKTRKEYQERDKRFSQRNKDLYEKNDLDELLEKDSSDEKKTFNLVSNHNKKKEEEIVADKDVLNEILDELNGEDFKLDSESEEERKLSIASPKISQNKKSKNSKNLSSSSESEGEESENDKKKKKTFSKKEKNGKMHFFNPKISNAMLM